MSEFCEGCHEINDIKEGEHCFNCRHAYQKGFEEGRKSNWNWRPIEEAPKDGTIILGAIAVKYNGTYGWEFHVIWFNDEEDNAISAECHQGWEWEDYDYFMGLPISLP